jgi:hypothetical protein
MNNKKHLFLNHETQTKFDQKGYLYCSAYVPMILKEYCSSKINGLVMKTFQGNMTL